MPDAKNDAEQSYYSPALLHVDLVAARFEIINKWECEAEVLPSHRMTTYKLVFSIKTFFVKLIGRIALADALSGFW